MAFGRVSLISAGAACLLWTRQMPDLEVRRATVETRRGGRRSHSAYSSHARGTRLLVGNDRVVRSARRQAAVDGRGIGAWSAGTALALVYPLMRRARRTWGKAAQDGAM